MTSLAPALSPSMANAEQVLLRVYHGPTARFDHFDFRRGGTHCGYNNGHLGAFFSTDREDAASYGSVVLEAQITISAPLRNRT